MLCCKHKIILEKKNRCPVVLENLLHRNLQCRCDSVRLDCCITQTTDRKKFKLPLIIIDIDR